MDYWQVDVNELNKNIDSERQKFYESAFQKIVRLHQIKDRLRQLENKPRYKNSIWMKDGKYPYKCYTDTSGVRVREYVGLKGYEDLMVQKQRHAEYEELKREFEKIYNQLLYANGYLVRANRLINE